MEPTSLRGAALVLEGGGMRGLYTTGVLDCFLDRGYRFEYVIGVSAGASHALSYISGQRGRARRVNIDYCQRSEYMGWGSLVRTGSFFGMDFIFRTIPEVHDPFDFKAFENNLGRYVVVVTNMVTGEAEYLEPREGPALFAPVMASCALPLASKPVYLGGTPYLDGGIADSLPLGKARSDGFERMVVVRTQPRDYRKKRTAGALLYRGAYGAYPRFVEKLKTRNERYNAALDELDLLEAQGSALVIAPNPQPGLKRMERDKILLEGLYRSGYADAEAAADRIAEFAR